MNRLITGLVCSLLVGFAGTSAMGGIVYSNFGPGQSFDTNGSYDIPNVSGSSSQLLAFSFTPTANYSFTGLDVAINRGDGAVTADVYLAEDSGGQPGLVLYSAAVAVPALGGVVSAPVGLTPVTLLADETYWLYLGTPIPNATLGWFLNSTGALGPLESNNGHQWSPRRRTLRGLSASAAPSSACPSLELLPPRPGACGCWDAPSPVSLNAGHSFVRDPSSSDGRIPLRGRKNGDIVRF